MKDLKFDPIENFELARLWRNTLKDNFRQTGLISKEQQESWRIKIQEDKTVQMFQVSSDTELFLGVCGLTSIDYVHSKAELSCYIASYQMEKELLTSIFKKLQYHAFFEFNLNRIWTETFETNTLHLDVLNLLKFKQEGTLRSSYFKKGRYIDSVIHSKLRKEYQNE